MAKVKAIIFDCWNTLFYVESSTRIFDRLAEVAGKKLDYKLRKKLEANLMRQPEGDAASAAESLLDELGADQSPTMIKKVVGILETPENQRQAYPDTINILKELKRRGYKVAMLSNTYQFALEPLREQYELDRYFDLIMPSYETGMIKPDSDLFKLVLDKLDVKPEEAMMVGDSLRDDVHGAEAADLQAVLIDRSGSPDLHSRRIRSLSELLNIL